MCEIALNKGKKRSNSQGTFYILRLGSFFIYLCVRPIASEDRETQWSIIFYCERYTARWKKAVVDRESRNSCGTRCGVCPRICFGFNG